MNLLRSQTGKILVEAHRGAETMAPPNSWAAILAAVEAGADLIEIDVQLASDDVAVVYHDYRLPDGDWVRGTPSTALRDLDVGDGRPPPLLGEVLEWLQGQSVGMTLDIKNGFGMGVLPFSAVLQEIERAGVADRVMLAAWDHMGLLWAKRHMPTLTTRALLRGNPLDLVAIATRAEVNAVALSYDLIDQSDVEALHEEGIAVVLAEMWEPNFRYAVDLGVDVVSWGEPAEAAYSLRMQRAR